MRTKRILSIVLAGAVSISSITIPTKEVKAEETAGEYVVMAVDDAAYEELTEEMGDVIVDAGEVSEVLEENNITLVELTETEAEELQESEDILLVEEDIILEASSVKSHSKKTKDSKTQLKAKLEAKKNKVVESVEAENQWNIDAIHANEKEYLQAEDMIKVAVMDTGLTATADIEVTERVNFIAGEEDVHPLYEDVSGHGTAVASVIAAKENSVGITGVNPNVELYSVKVLDDNRQGKLSNIIQGIYWCMEKDVDIINMSFGTAVKSEMLAQVIKEADDAGILMIAAAGNLGEKEGESTVEYPAAFEEVLAVGATNQYGEVSEISSLGEEIELMAPGEKIPATGYYGEIIQTEGSSMAAPHVTGAASVLWAKDKTKSAKFIRDLLKASAISLNDEKTAGSGMIDLEYALSVYDEFAANYAEDMETEDMIEENPSEIESYTDEMLEACWATSLHEETIATEGSYCGLDATQIAYIKLGAKYTDTESVFRQSSDDDSDLQVFHGIGNYVANYMYVMRMAEICYASGLNTALASAVYPADSSSQKSNIKGTIETFFGNHSNDDWTKKQKAYIMVGIASHIAMDTYAHRAYQKKDDGTWELIPKVKPNIRDNITHIGNRWTCAKSIAYDILVTWDERADMDADATEFYQPGIHKKDKFKLHKFSEFVEKADLETYNLFSKWYKERTGGV